MITYIWEFPLFDCYPTEASMTDVVFDIHWIVTATDTDGHTASIYNIQSIVFDPEEPFTPFDQITFEQTKEWVQSAMGINQVIALQESLDKMIEDQVHPKSISLPAPWIQ